MCAMASSYFEQGLGLGGALGYRYLFGGRNGGDGYGYVAHERCAGVCWVSGCHYSTWITWRLSGLWLFAGLVSFRGYTQPGYGGYRYTQSRYGGFGFGGDGGGGMAMGGGGGGMRTNAGFGGTRRR